MLRGARLTFGGRPLFADIGFGRDVNDFTSIATRVAGLGKVDVIPTYTLEGQGLKITQALAQAGVVKGGGGQSIQLGTIWLPFGFEQKAGKAALGYIRIVQFDPTDQFPSPLTPQDFSALLTDTLSRRTAPVASAP